MHEYGDRRLPVPGAIGILAAALSAVFAASPATPRAPPWAPRPSPCSSPGSRSMLRVAAPINRELTAAARAHVTPPGARALQRRWDGVINVRAALQGVALVLLLVVIATV